MAARDAEDAAAAAAAAAAAQGCHGSLNSRGHNGWVMSDLAVVGDIDNTLSRNIIIFKGKELFDNNLGMEFMGGIPARDDKHFAEALQAGVLQTSSAFVLL